jgi:hypothetical protein
MAIPGGEQIPPGLKFNRWLWEQGRLQRSAGKNRASQLSGQGTSCVVPGFLFLCTSVVDGLHPQLLTLRAAIPND